MTSARGERLAGFSTFRAFLNASRALRWNYATALYEDAGATLDDVREAVATLEELARTARRVLGGTHPTAAGIEESLRNARAALRARETPPPGSA